MASCVGPCRSSGARPRSEFVGGSLPSWRPHQSAGPPSIIRRAEGDKRSKEPLRHDGTLRRRPTGEPTTCVRREANPIQARWSPSRAARDGFGLFVTPIKGPLRCVDPCSKFQQQSGHRCERPQLHSETPAKTFFFFFFFPYEVFTGFYLVFVYL